MSGNISKNIGLQVSINNENRLEFGNDAKFDGESVRKMSDLKVVAVNESLDLADTPAYFMYRNVHRAQDEQKISKNNLRFDLTVIPANNLGEEFIKTSGHYHPEKPGTGIEYPELYYVISGQATYLMQKHEKDGSISDVILARVRPSQTIIMPLGYGHVTINELDEPLVMANWVEKNFKSEYGDFETKRGASYYLMTDKSVVKNPRYEKVPEIKTMESNPEKIAELKDTPIYNYVDSIEKIELIAKPEEYLAEFKIDKLFK